MVFSLAYCNLPPANSQCYFLMPNLPW
jgi:hypothetical protein